MPPFADSSFTVTNILVYIPTHVCYEELKCLLIKDALKTSLLIAVIVEKWHIINFKITSIYLFFHPCRVCFRCKTFSYSFLCFYIYFFNTYSLFINIIQIILLIYIFILFIFFLIFLSSYLLFSSLFI